MAPAIVQKMLAQSGASQGFSGANPAGGRAIHPQPQPSTQQLRMLVQQIQMAVQAGYLNHQVRELLLFSLNRPNRLRVFIFPDFEPTAGTSDFGTTEPAASANQEFAPVGQSAVHQWQAEQHRLAVFSAHHEN